MADGKMIRVSETVHEKVSNIAGANYRGLGDQVAYWADHTCVHPAECREARHVLVFPVAQANKNKVAHLEKAQKQRGFYCSSCRQLVILDLPAEINDLVNTEETIS